MKIIHVSNGIPMGAQISLSNSEMLNLILNFYTKPKCIIADVTYGLGAFWKIKPIDRLILFSDLEPVNQSIRKMDFNNLQFKDSIIDCIVFDQPYLNFDFRRNYSHSNKNGFAGYDSKTEIKHIIQNSNFPLQEFNRVLKQTGIVINKNSKLENDSGMKQIDVFISVTPQVIAFPTMKKSRQNYSVWHVLQK